MFSFQLFIFKRNYLENGRRQSNSERKIICHMEYVLSQEAAYQISEQSDKKKIKCNTLVVAQTSFEKKNHFFSIFFKIIFSMKISVAQNVFGKTISALLPWTIGLFGTPGTCPRRNADRPAAAIPCSRSDPGHFSKKLVKWYKIKTIEFFHVTRGLWGSELQIFLLILLHTILLLMHSKGETGIENSLVLTFRIFSQIFVCSLVVKITQSCFIQFW